jgi:hypothetical protein
LVELLAHVREASLTGGCVSDGLLELLDEGAVAGLASGKMKESTISSFSSDSKRMNPEVFIVEN